jgi:uncharacterized protein with PhoU and TrkA domain
LSDKDTLENITNQLVELKNTSELSIDLAYSALLLNNTYLAEEVQILHQRIENLNIDLEQLLLSCQLSGDDSRGLISLIRMGIAAERISLAASKIAQVVLRGIEPHPVLKMMIQAADETVDRFTVPEGSPLIGKNLKTAQLPEETGWWILAIKRGDRWVRPKASTIVEIADLLIASGYSDGEEDFKQIVTGKSSHLNGDAAE